VGPFNRNARANGDLYQNYTQVNGIETAQTVTVLAVPARWRDRLNANLGLFAQDIWNLNRLTLTYGLRWEYVSEQVDGPAGAAGPLRQHPRRSTTSRCRSGRAGRRALVWSTTCAATARPRSSSASTSSWRRPTTTLAELYDPASGNTITQSLPWTDKNLDDIAQGERGCDFTVATCEINFASLRPNFGTGRAREPGSGSDAPVRAAVQHRDHARAVPRRVGELRVVPYRQQELPRTQQPEPARRAERDGTVTNASYRPVTVFSPIDGTPITVYDVASAAVGSLAAKNLDTNDKGLHQAYNSFEFGVNARLPRGARLSGGFGTEQTVANTCSAAAVEPELPDLDRRGQLLRPEQERDSLEDRRQDRRHVPAALVRPDGQRRVSGSARIHTWHERV
jgi:hypothetical protein